MVSDTKYFPIHFSSFFRGQGAQIVRNESYFSYAAVTSDASQRRIRTFYKTIRFDPLIYFMGIMFFDTAVYAGVPHVSAETRMPVP
jgi:hypothetical protein